MPILFLNAAFVSKEQLLFLHSMFSFSSYCNINTFYCIQYRSCNKGYEIWIRHIPLWIRHIPLQNIDTSSSNTVDNTELQTLILVSI